jgi:predicted permease
VDPGFDTAQILSMDIPADFQSGRSPAAIRNQYLSILDGVRALPGVRSAALTSSVPLGNQGFFTGQTDIDVEGHEPVPGAPKPRAKFRVVSPGFFATMGIDLRGRDFTTTDVREAQKVVIINQSMARAHFGDRDPVGRRIAWTDALLARFLGVGPEMRTVVGVVADTRDAGVDADAVHAMYNAFPQVGVVGSLVVRVAGDPNAVLPAVRQVIASHDPTQPIENVATIEALGDESVAPRRLNAMLLGGFALLALIIAAVGIGGVLAFSVGSRAREFGVRSALGAARHQIWSGVVAEGAGLAAIGVVLGSAIAVAVTRFIAGLLVGVPALDPVTFLFVGLLLGAVAVVAAWVPAWRAARVSPMEVLGAE